MNATAPCCIATHRHGPGVYIALRQGTLEGRGGVAAENGAHCAPESSPSGSRTARENSARAEQTLPNAAVPAVDLASLVIGGTKDLVCGTFTGRSHSSAPGVTDAGWDGSAAANTVRVDPMRSRIRGTNKGRENGQQ